MQQTDVVERVNGCGIYSNDFSFNQFNELHLLYQE
jgi:hypothetical protein